MVTGIQDTFRPPKKPHGKMRVLRRPPPKNGGPHNTLKTPGNTVATQFTSDSRSRCRGRWVEPRKMVGEERIFFCWYTKTWINQGVVWCSFFLVPLWEPTTFIVTTWILYESIGAGSLGHYTWIIYRYSYISPLVLTWPKWTIHFGQIQCKNVHATTNIIKTPIIHTHLDIAMNLNK